VQRVPERERAHRVGRAVLHEEADVENEGGHQRQGQPQSQLHRPLAHPPGTDAEGSKLRVPTRPKLRDSARTTRFSPAGVDPAAPSS
jgi:hypothetical protein